MTAVAHGLSLYTANQARRGGIDDLVVLTVTKTDAATWRVRGTLALRGTRISETVDISGTR